MKNELKKILSLIILATLLVSCNFKKSYKHNGNVAFIYKGKLLEIEGEHLSEYPKDQYYMLFDSIQIKKSDVTELVIEVSTEMDDVRYVEEEEFHEEEDYYDEYSFFIQGKEIIRITEKFVMENPGYFK